MLQNISPESMKDKLFEDFSEDDCITVHELSRTFRRKPLKCTKDTLKLAHYLIKPKGHNEHEEKVTEVIKRMQTLVSDYTVFTEESDLEARKGLEEVLIGRNHRN